MGGLGGMLRTVVRRARAQWPLLLAAWLLLVSALTLVAAAVAYTDDIATASLRHSVGRLLEAERGVGGVTTYDADRIVAVDAAVKATAAGRLGVGPGDAALTLRGSTLAPSSAAADDVSHLTTLAAYEALPRHVALVSGAWAVAGKQPLQATLSEAAAQKLGVGAGARLELVDRAGAGKVDAVVTGIWRPAPDDPYWSGGALERTGEEALGRYVYRGPLAVDAADLVAIGGRLDAEWRVTFPPAGLTADRIPALQAGLADLRQRLAAAAPGSGPFQVSSGLPAVLDDAGPAILSSRASVLAVTAQFGVLGGYAVLLVAGIVVDRRRAETAQLRARGATSFHLGMLALCESVLLVVAAGIAASYLGGRVVRALAAAGPMPSLAPGADGGGGPGGLLGALSSAPFWAAPEVVAIGGAIAVVALVLPSVLSGGPLAGARAALARQAGQTLPQRLGIDLALAAVAAVAIWQLRLYGAPLVRNARGAIGLDPLLVAAPALGLLAAAVLATRLGPRLTEIAESLLVERGGTLVSLLARQLGRRPLRYTRGALLLMLAAALGTFAAAYATTWNRSQADQAAYQAAADVRTAEPNAPQLEAWAEGPLFRGVPGVVAATGVTSDDITVGRQLGSASLLAVDAANTTSLHLGSGEARLLRSIASHRSATGGVPLPPNASRLTITLDAALTPSGSNGVTGTPLTPAQLAGGQVEVAVVVETRDGLHEFTGGRAAYSGANQRVDVDLGATLDGRRYAADGPMTIESLELTVLAPPDAMPTGAQDVSVDGTLAIRSIDAGDASIPLPAAPAWRWSMIQGPYIQPFEATGPAPVSLAFAEGAGRPFFTLGSPDSVMYRYWPAAAAGTVELPVVASDSLLTLAGAHRGDLVLASDHGRPLALRIVETTATFAPLDPARPFVVVDRPSLELWRYRASGNLTKTTGWWLGVEPGASGVATAVELPPLSATQVVDRAALVSSLTTDPIAIGILAALGLGAIAALAIATIGFLMSAWVSGAERMREFAVLQALGLSRRSVVTWLAAENAILLAFGVSLGIAVGAGLAWLVLPYASLTRTGEVAIPSPVVIVPWPTVVLIAAGGSAVLLAAAWWIARRAGRAGVAATLRSMEDA